MVKPSDSDSRALRPESRFSLTLAQAAALGLVIGGAGFSVGALYPRMTAAEGAITKIQASQSEMALALAKATTVLDRLERNKQ